MHNYYPHHSSNVQHKLKLVSSHSFFSKICALALFKKISWWREGLFVKVNSIERKEYLAKHYKGRNPGQYQICFLDKWLCICVDHPTHPHTLMSYYTLLWWHCNHLEIVIVINQQGSYYIIMTHSYYLNRDAELNRIWNKAKKIFNRKTIHLRIFFN